MLSRLLSAAVRGNDDQDTTWHLGTLVLVAIISSVSVSRPCRVQFTNRFTEQAIDLHFSYLIHLPRVPSLGGTVSRVAKRLPIGPSSPLLRPYAP
jgi:hypothetical protein